MAIDNPARSRFSFRITDADRGSLLQEVALYPVDEPASFLLRLPQGTKRLAIEAHAEHDPLPPRIIVRLSTGAARD